MMALPPPSPTVSLQETMQDGAVEYLIMLAPPLVSLIAQSHKTAQTMVEGYII